MHALTFSRSGGPRGLEWTALPDPRPAPGIAVVSTHAIGLNFADIYRRQGRYHLAGSPPWIAGYEAAGEIAALHPDESSGAFRIGQRVAFTDSAFANAERVAVPLDRLIALPNDIDFETAFANWRPTASMSFMTPSASLWPTASPSLTLAASSSSTALRAATPPLSMRA